MGRQARISGSEINLDGSPIFFGQERKSTAYESITIRTLSYRVHTESLSFDLFKWSLFDV